MKLSTHCTLLEKYWKTWHFNEYSLIQGDVKVICHWNVNDLLLFSVHTTSSINIYWNLNFPRLFSSSVLAYSKQGAFFTADCLSAAGRASYCSLCFQPAPQFFFTFAHHVHRARFSAMIVAALMLASPNHCNTFFVHAPKVAKSDEKHRQMDLYWHSTPPKQWNVIFMLNYLIFWPFPNDAVARNSARTHSSAMEAGARYVLFWARSIPFHSTYIFSTFQAFDVSGLVVT